MKKLLVLFVVVCLGFMLVSCDDNDNSLYDGDVTTHENPSLIGDLVNEIKGVFED